MSAASHESVLYHCVRHFILFLIKVLTRLDVQGLERTPAEGPLIVAANHLHVLDAPIVFALVPRRLTAFAADKWRDKVAGWLMRVVANAIFVARGEPDRLALDAAMKVLQRGGALGLAPEGTRSRTGGLLPGKNGAAYLASRSGAVILPMAIWGQERAMRDWAHLRRPIVHVRIGEPLQLPNESRNARSVELQGYTNQIMLAIARMLPPEYRGVYTDKVKDAA